MNLTFVRSALPLVSLCALLFFHRASGVELLPPGFRPQPLGVHALVGGAVVVRPGETMDPGVIIIRDGLIEAVGPAVPLPADARIWDMKGTTIYAGFIEPCLILNQTNPPISTTDIEPIDSQSFTAGGVKFFGALAVKTDMGQPGAGHDVMKVTPQARAVDRYSPAEKSISPLRELGFTSAVIAPGKGILRGSSALVALTEENPNQTILKPDVFQHIAFETHQEDDQAYPGSLMGVIATIRQSIFDAQHYGLERADYARRPQGRRPPEFNPALEALQSVISNKARVMIEPGSALMVDRAAKLSRELGLEICIVASGQEWRRPDLAKQTGATFVVPVNFPAAPKMPEESDWDQVELEPLRAWDWAPENPALLRQQGLSVALTTYGLGDKKEFRSKLRLALDRGLSETDALAALTTVPAKLCGVEQQLGTIEPGKFADLTIVAGKSYFEPEAKVSAVWIAGRIYPAPPEAPKPSKPEETKAKETPAAPATPATPPKEEPEKYPQPPATAQAEPPPAATPTNGPPEAPKTEPPAAEKKPDKKEELRQLQKTRVARSPLEGRGPITNAASILIRNATIWTSGPSGTLTNANLLISNGKVLSVGNFPAEPGVDTLVIDGTGLHVTPGIIDCHSHTAILGAVNEATLPSTAMVRISDVVNSETENLYQQLAGGVTAANLLHGSANPIGGQNCVIKLRNGAAPDELIFARAPAGIKFALGENVKQSNWGERHTTRYPQTRMGVRTFIENRFLAAQQYLEALQRAETNRTLPPARDLELETLGEILRGKRWIHCHSYRQDEILMLLRLMESFGVRIASLQHILEGYKVADEIAAHGAGASSFTDWWGFKFEVYDAIPYNAAILHERGVTVSFNSDSSELARRLYLEAAKAVKYGGISEVEALRFITLNPAKQLQVDGWIGSLEPGKDADFAIWSKSPLAYDTVCLQTWIEGKKYFDRSLNDERVARLQKEREDLLAKIKQIAALSGGGGSTDAKNNESFFRVSLEHEFDGKDRHCLEDER